MLAGAPLDGGIAINEAMVQVDVLGGFVEVGLLKKLAADSETLRASFSRHEEMVLAQVQQVAACNAPLLGAKAKPFVAAEVLRERH